MKVTYYYKVRVKENDEVKEVEIFDIPELAKCFQVSYPAMCVRLFNLGFISSL